METYIVHFWSKSTNKLVHTIEIETDNTNGIGMQAKLHALSQDDFKFNSRKHTLSWCKKSMEVVI